MYQTRNYHVLSRFGQDGSLHS